MLTIRALLVLAAFLVIVVAGMGKAPLWVGALLLAVAQLLDVFPVGA